MTKFTKDENRIVTSWIDEHDRATQEGKFGKANIIRNKLERLGIEGDFECNFEPPEVQHEEE